MIGEDQIGLLLQGFHEGIARSHALALEHEAATFQLVLQPCSIRRVVLDNYNSKFFLQGFHLSSSQPSAEPYGRHRLGANVFPWKLFTTSPPFAALSSVVFATDEDR